MSRKVNPDQLINVWNNQAEVGSSKDVQDIVYKDTPGTKKQKDLSQVLQQTKDQGTLISKTMRKPIVLVETPYKFEDQTLAIKHERYAKMCLEDSVKMRKECAIVPHMLYAQVLNFRDQAEHDLALTAHLSLVPAMNYMAVYTDYGVSPAMQAAINMAKSYSKKIEYRILGKVVG